MALKPIDQQVVVITGASSGIGRETARRLARAGARVVAASRSDAALASLVADITRDGGTADRVVCDVTDLAQVQALADRAEERFGRIDTWVNNAGVLLYADFERTAPEEFRRMMEVNFLSVVHGAQVALPALRRAGGGALVTVSSGEAMLSLPFHSAYAASKHAVDGALDSLRRELIARGDPISVAVVRPAVIDTPIYAIARSRLTRRPSAPPPYYDPVVVAACIEFAATHPVRDVYAGGAARAMAALQAVVPRTVDQAFGRVGIRLMQTDDPAAPREGNLDVPLDPGRSRRGLPRTGRRFSLYTWLAVRPALRRTLTAAASVVAVSALARRIRRR